MKTVNLLFSVKLIVEVPDDADIEDVINDLDYNYEVTGEGRVIDSELLDYVDLTVKG